MGKKRVHEIAKERGLTSKEVLAALHAAGVEAKAPASSVEEEVAARALTPAGPGGGSKGAGASKPATKAGKPAASPGGARPPKAVPGAGGAAPQGRPARPGAGGGGKRRRVVIDSQAARRDHIQQSQPQQRPPRRKGGRRRRPILEEPEPRDARTAVAEPEAIPINSGASVREVAEHLDVSAAEVIKKMMEMGEMATLTQTLSDEAIQTLADGFDRKIEIFTAADTDQTVIEVAEEDEDALVERPPVVTIMGHVDHGKTSLLDAIREAQVAAGEAGGITQHIGAYQVRHTDREITFIDTPGHQAFTAMRARGARVTDIAVIVVAADDGVMPQTVEAIDHARAAEVPMVVAVNKVDKPDADPQRVRGELAAHKLTPEDWGGDTVFCDVSAKTRDGLENLLDMLLLVAEVQELKANPEAAASGTVVESQLDPGRGPVVTVLVQRGTLRVGDALVAGENWGRIRAMHNFLGGRVEVAPPGMPVEVLGFDGVPEAGEIVRAVDTDRSARQQATRRAQRLRTETLARRQSRKISLEDVFAKVQEGELKQLNLVLKSDVSGSLEALQDEIAKLPHEQVALNVIHAATGGINESDVMLASASDAVIIGFNVRPFADARHAAEHEGVDIRTYSVIYKVTEDLRAAMEGMLEPEEVEETIGQAEVREVFKSSRVGGIAGSYVNEGKVTRGAKVRLVREGTVVWTGRIGSLRRFKEDVREVQAGYECGIVLEGYGDVKQDDVLEAFETKQVEKTLE